MSALQAKEKKDRLEIMNKILEFVKEKEARFGAWSTKEIDVLNECCLLTSKTASRAESGRDEPR